MNTGKNVGLTKAQENTHLDERIMYGSQGSAVNTGRDAGLTKAQENTHLDECIMYGSQGSAVNTGRDIGLTKAQERNTHPDERIMAVPRKLRYTLSANHGMHPTPNQAFPSWKVLYFQGF